MKIKNLIHTSNIHLFISNSSHFINNTKYSAIYLNAKNVNFYVSEIHPDLHLNAKFKILVPVHTHYAFARSHTAERLNYIRTCPIYFWQCFRVREIISITTVEHCVCV